MFHFSNVQKAGHAIERNLQGFHLEHSLSELFKIYERTGGPTAQVESAINSDIDRCLTEVRLPKSTVQSHLYVLLRAKDMHRYVVEEPQLVAVKLKLLEHVLFYRGLEERWAAVRDLLLNAVDTICRVAVAGVASNFEVYKQQISSRTSSLGRLLAATALFNFDVAEEYPPTNLRIRFPKRRFPDHSWEVENSGAAGVLDDKARVWSPGDPLCRWEYLAADLLHALYRRQAPAGRGQIRAAEGGAAGQAPQAESGDVYCALGREGNPSVQTDQMELFPLHPRTFLPELQRQVHRAHGAEGVRLFALLFEQLGRSICGEFLSLALADIARGPVGPEVSAAKAQQRAKKLWAILEFLSQVELTRLHANGGDTTCQRSKLIAILEVIAPHDAAPHDAAGRGAGAATARSHDSPEQVRLLVDPCFYREGGLGAPYGDLPAPLLCAAPKEHPYALGLLVYLRQAWEAEWEATQGVIRRTAQAIFHEAGFWLKAGSRYRSIEAMKRDLAYLKEQGWLGSWRISRGTARDAMDDTYRLEAPGGERISQLRPAPGRRETSVSA